MHSTFEHTPQRYLRFAGLMYLAIIVLGSFGELYVRGVMVRSGDASATASAIAAAPMLWRLGIAGDLLMHTFDIPVILTLYYLLKPVSKALSLLATLFNMIQSAVLVANKLSLLLPLYLLDNTAYLQAFSPEQRHALTYLAIKAHGYGFSVGLIFFGVACLLRARLIYRSGFLPKWLGALLFGAGVCYLANSVAVLLASSLANVMFPLILLPSFLGELVLCFWLIFKGVDLAQWRARLHTEKGDAHA
jgi:hypothetical protein